MVYLYILKNKFSKHYIGITGLNPVRRLERHNKGDVASTKNHKPWELIYFEEIGNFKEARNLEKKIKGWKGGNAFKKFLSKAAGSSNGRTSDSESEYLGSNPSPAALARKRIPKLGCVS